MIQMLFYRLPPVVQHYCRALVLVTLMAASVIFCKSAFGQFDPGIVGPTLADPEVADSEFDVFYHQPGIGSYHTTEAGTYVVSGNRIFLFENIQLPEEIANSLSSLIYGVLWKESYLLSHELFLGAIWPTLPGSVRWLLRSTSQAWLLWITAHELLAVSSPVVTLLHHYYHYWYSPRYQGALAILVNDPELSFRLFLQVYFPKELVEPAQVIIDRVPPMLGLPPLTQSLTGNRMPLNPWNKLLDEMARSDIERLELSGNDLGDIRIRFREGSSHEQLADSSLQTIIASVNREYHPVPWLLEKIRRRIDPKAINIHTSLLSQEVLELVITMLACRRITANESQKVDTDFVDTETLCAGGHIEKNWETLRYVTAASIAPVQITERRLLTKGRLFSLTGCNLSEQALCWENTLVVNEGHQLYPWPALTLSSRLSTFQERNSWILMGHEPQQWITGSFFQIRVPELFTRILLASFHLTSQTVVNRLVASLHHRWWGNGFVPEPQPALPSSEALVNFDQHAYGDEYCLSCRHEPCHYPKCPVCMERFWPETMVNLGCNEHNREAINHHLCTSCYFRLLTFSNVSECNECRRYHRSMIQPGNYFADPDNPRGVPACPLCRQPFNHEHGNMGNYLGGECNALRRKINWLFSDSLGADSPHHYQNETETLNQTEALAQ